MTLANTISKGRSVGLRVAAAYATSQAALKTAKTVADQVCHTWHIDNAYAEDTFEAAVKLATEHQRAVPGSRRHDVIGNSWRQDDRFNSFEWTWVPVRGVSLALQARLKAGGEDIEFRAPRLKDLDALRQRVAEIEEAMGEDELDISVNLGPTPSYTTIYSWDKDEWGYRMNRLSRTFDSVVLPKGTQDEIEDELKRFSDSRERLTRLEMPWRRGYLLSGPPGTGKTSLSLAIAGALGFNLASLSLTDIKSDGALRKAVSNLQARTVLVIEDIDAYSVSHERDHNAEKDGSLSLSGLLNSLDGFETPEGLVTILTTNHIEKLDPALIRSGRVDRVFTLDYIAGPELVRLFQWFYETKAPGLSLEMDRALADAKLCPAEAAELFKQHLDDPAAGWEAVCNRVQPRLHLATTIEEEAA